MYKCTDCGKEFDIKPEYCDCGNNIFEEIVIKKSKQEVEPQKPTIKEVKKPEYDERSILERLNISIYALLFFILCIILSVFSVMFLGNDSLKNLQNQPQEQAKVLEPVKNLPSINKIWDDTLPKIILPQPVEAVKSVPQTTVKPAPVKVLPAIKKQVQKTSKTTSNVVKQIVSQQSKNQVYIPKTTSQIASGVTTPVKKQSQNVQPQTVQTQTASVAKTTPAVDKVTLQKELLSYKIELRNKIAKNINFAEVVGDGNCAVTFRIDSVGNLINRKFSVQSNNNSLNDAVYHAVMQNPSYKTPPQGYKNETITLTVRMYGGNFEVDLR